MTAVLVAMGGIALADNITADGDSVTVDNDPNIQSNCTVEETEFGSARIAFQGSSHFVAGATLQVTVTADSPVTAVGPATTTLPTTWASGSTHTFSGINTTIPAGTTGTKKVTVQVEGSKAGGGSLTISDFFNVECPTAPPPNTAPNVTIDSGATAVNEGDAATTYAYSWTDPDANTWTRTTSCGATGTKSNDVFTPATKTGSFDCAWADDQPTATASDVETVSVTIGDGTASDTDTRNVTISNVAPFNVSATFASGASCTTAATLNFSFSDPGADSWDAQIDWDYDGTFSAEETKTGVSKNDSASHTYGTAGAHTAAIRILDDDTGVSSVQTAGAWVDYNLSSILQPVNDTRNGQPVSLFKYGSTIPVKVEITDCDDSHPNNLDVRIGYSVTSANTPPGTDEPYSSGSANTGVQLRFSDPLYIYNLATKSVSPDATCSVRIYVTIMNGTSVGQSTNSTVGFKK